MTIRNSRRWRTILITSVVVIAVLGVPAWYYLLREVKTEYASDTEHFKYGSVGVEAANGAPYWVWKVLPRVCSKHLPGENYDDAFGLTWEKGKDAPIGLPVMTVGFRRIGINCGLCHTARVRTSEYDAPAIYYGAPSSTVDLQGYLRFLFACAESREFNSGRIMTAIAAVHDLPVIERLLYRFLVIPQTKRALLAQKRQLGWMDRAPDWGPGRQDPFNPAKTQILRLPYDDSIGNSDIMPLWNWGRREGFGLHWDGLNTSLTEIFLNSGIGNGANNDSIDRPSLERIQAWIQTQSPSQFPFSVDPHLASEGEKVFKQYCADCHAFGGASTGRSIRLDRLETDPHRLATWSHVTAEAFNSLSQYDWRYTHFQATYGYKSVALDGIWVRAPYLHNGSVPSLQDLLAPPGERPTVFYRGYDVYDPVKVGFVYEGEDAEREGFRFDTGLPGNSNRGHSWGTELDADAKAALLEYMKTL